METQRESLVEMIESLPPELQQEVKEFVEELRRREQKQRQRLKLTWRGALRDLRDRYTSVELQHQIRDCGQVYLLDTSILLELLLEQERADEVEQFLRFAPGGSLYLSDFSLYSLGLILTRRARGWFIIGDTFCKRIRSDARIGCLKSAQKEQLQ